MVLSVSLSVDFGYFRLSSIGKGTVPRQATGPATTGCSGWQGSPAESDLLCPGLHSRLRDIRVGVCSEGSESRRDGTEQWWRGWACSGWGSAAGRSQLVCRCVLQARWASRRPEVSEDIILQTDGNRPPPPSLFLSGKAVRCWAPPGCSLLRSSEWDPDMIQKGTRVTLFKLSGEPRGRALVWAQSVTITD